MYVPPLSGDIRSLPLRGRVDLEPAAFMSAADTLKTVLGNISDDYSVQAFFGKLWFKNAVRNLFIAERSSAPLPPIRRAAVTAAGPSLEDQIPALRDAKASGVFLIATDTSLPVLMGRGLVPNAVISIDCQHISYYHFLGGIAEGLPLILDLASPSTLCRLGIPYASSRPAIPSAPTYRATGGPSPPSTHPAATSRTPRSPLRKPSEPSRLCSPEPIFPIPKARATPAAPTSTGISGNLIRGSPR